MSTPTQPATALWTATPPTAWPAPPTDLTFSALKEIEACPRRWALSAASYPTIWAGYGYPQRLQLKALAGTVVHAALETITKELVSAGCPSIQDAAAVGVLQRLGGISVVIHGAIDDLLARTAGNPRAACLMDYYTRTLRAQAPELRSRVQNMLARRILASKPRSAKAGGGRHERTALREGLYCEIDFRVAQLGWKGRADLLVLASDVCEIIDFKTGEPSEEHVLQLQTYALLWNRDESLNPTGRLATRLVLAHLHADVEVPVPTTAELAELEAQLSTRGAVARAAITVHPPEARPSAQKCRYCGVRQLCETYWRPEIREFIASQAGEMEQRFVDVEVSVQSRHGLKSWDIMIHSGAERVMGLLRTAGNVELVPGQQLRILGAARAVEDIDSNIQCLTIGVLSEMYVVTV
jgi:CRISPR/Cas system-associated exonuclease Cas4 (RecB family)